MTVWGKSRSKHPFGIDLRSHPQVRAGQHEDWEKTPDFATGLDSRGWVARLLPASEGNHEACGEIAGWRLSRTIFAK